MKIRGKVTKIFYKNDGWAAFRLTDASGKVHSCAGTVCDIKEGLELEIEGVEEESKYGRQIKVEASRMILPKGKEGIRSFLASGLIKGIGPRLADKLVDAFGDKLFEIIKDSPEKLSEIPGISVKKAASIIDGALSYSHFADIYDLTGGEITQYEAGKILKQYGSKAIDVLKTDPYRLTEDIDGFGFLKTDKIAKAVGISPKSVSRATAAINYVLSQLSEKQGDCYLPVELLQQETLTILLPIPKELDGVRGLKNAALSSSDDPAELIKKYKLNDDQSALLCRWISDRTDYINALADALIACQEKDQIHIDAETVASTKLYRSEQIIAEDIKHMLGNAPLCTDIEAAKACLEEFEKEQGYAFTREQRMGVITGVCNRLSILTGGPGCGKTSTIKAIVATWQKLIGGQIVLMAPTGRAAARIKETLPDKSIISATIHKMTGMGGKMPPLATPDKKTLIICDESSMISVELARFVTGFSRESSLVLVGDKDQLPPIGAGNFFKDLILSKKVHTTTLTMGFRNVGNVALNAQRVNHGDNHIQAGEDFAVSYMNREDIADRVVEDYCREIQEGTDPKDMCLLTLQRTRGTSCVYTLNKKIQNAYNPLSPSSPQLDGCELRVGDRVMQIRNDYNQEYTITDEAGSHSGKGVFNGDTGRVENISAEDGTLTVLFDDGRFSEYEGLSLSNLVLAYAMTVHKAQGSEYKKIFFAGICMDAYLMLSRAVVYTGLTRCSKKAYIYCEKKAFAMAVRRESDSVRRTRLVEFLCA